MMSDQLAQAGMLMGIGMTVVFAFLTLLIAGIHGIAWFARTFPEPEPIGQKNAKTKYSKNTSSSTTVEPNIVAAISAAVNAHRRKKN